MKNKKAELTVKEIIEFVLAAAVIVLLVFLLFALISPYWNKYEKTAESYLSSLESTIESVDRTGEGIFSLWDLGADAKMVYFGMEERVSLGEDSWMNFEGGENVLCFCFEKTSGSGVWDCTNGLSLDKPAEFTKYGKIVPVPVFEEGWKFTIKDMGVKYVFEAEYLETEE